MNIKKICDTIFDISDKKARQLLEGDTLRNAYEYAMQLYQTGAAEENAVDILCRLAEVSADRFDKQHIDPNDVFATVWHVRCRSNDIYSAIDFELKWISKANNFNWNLAAKTLFEELDIDDDFYYVVRDHLFKYCSDLSFLHDAVMKELKENPDFVLWGYSAEIVGSQIMTREELVQVAVECNEKFHLEEDDRKYLSTEYSDIYNLAKQAE